MNESNLWGRIKARHLQSNVYTLVAFFILFVVSTVLYALIPNGLPGEIFIAISTSLLASLFIGFFDIYTEYKNFENAQFIDNLYTFGIHNLYFDKKEVLERLIDKAQHEIWISGYRLILTKDLAKNLYHARQSGVTIRLLICPAWTETYRLTYKDSEASVENYLSIINVLCHNDDNPNAGTLEIRFTSTPLFNDTYLVDDKIVTSPYMHNSDLEFGVISARDFFTYEVDQKYRLFQLLKDEYMLLWNNAEHALTQEQAHAISKTISDERAEMRYLDYWKKVDLFFPDAEKKEQAPAPEA